MIPGGEPVIGVGEHDSYKTMLKFSDLPFAQRHGFKRGYAEPYDWLHNQFRDWASMFLSAMLYYEEKDETMRELHRRALTAYSGVAPYYRIIMNDDAPALKWDFHSLLQAIQLFLSVMLTDANRPLRACPECVRLFTPMMYGRYFAQKSVSIVIMYGEAGITNNKIPNRK